MRNVKHDIKEWKEFSVY